MVDSRDPSGCCAGASPIDVYRSDDSGASWRKLPNPDMPARCKGPFASRVMRFAQHPTRPNEIYAALRDQRRDAHDRRRRELDRIAAPG